MSGAEVLRTSSSDTLGMTILFYRATDEASLTITNNAANPASNTPLSNPTEIVCNRANSASKGFPAAIASIDPICARNTAIFGLTATCEITVKIIINTTHKAAGATKAVKLRIRKARTSKITTPQTIPIQSIRPSEYPTIAPAWSRLASTENAPGATTKLKKPSLPSQYPKPKNSIVRKKILIIYSDEYTAGRKDGTYESYSTAPFNSRCAAT